MPVRAIVVAGLVSAAVIGAPGPIRLALADQNPVGRHAPVKTPEAPPPLPAPSAMSFKVDIPTVESSGSSIADTDLKDILSGNVAAHADALASLNAASIHVPEYDVSYTTKGPGGQDVSGEVIFHDLLLSNVTNGVAASVSVASTTLTNSLQAQGAFGKMSADNFDIGGLLAFYGLVKGDPNSAPRTIYENFQEDSGSFTAPKGRCTIGASSVATFKARPLKVSFADFMQAMNQADAEQDDVKPEVTGKIIDFLADVADAIYISPIHFAGLNCNGEGDDGKPVNVSVGDVQLGEFAHGRYPSIAVNNFAVDATGDGSASLASFVFKGMDFSKPLAVLKAAGSDVDENWFEAHYRELIPEFGGFSFTGAKMDVPDDEHPGERIQGSLAAFDLSLSDYVNGIPTHIASDAQHFVGAIPKDSSDEFAQQLLQYGVDSFDVGYDIDVNWDAVDQEVHLNKFSITGDHMGSLAAAAVIGNATRDLFSTDLPAAMDAGLAVTVKQVSVDLEDAGLANIIAAEAARKANKDPKTFRKAMAALTQGSLLTFFGGIANAEQITDDVASFISGKATSLSVKMTAKDPAGLSLQDFMDAEDDPTDALGKVDLQSEAK